MKKLLRNRGLVERVGGGSSWKEGGFQIFSSVFLQKSLFYNWIFLSGKYSHLL